MTLDSATARALRTLELVQTHPGIGAGALADRLGVSDRAARRHVAVLREAGVSIESVPGPGGGYRIGRGPRAMPLLLTAEELLALVMAVLEVPGLAAERDRVIHDALSKLLGALPQKVAAPARAVHENAAAVPSRWNVRPSAAIVLNLVSAIGDHLRVRIGYRLPDGRFISRTVDPWAVVVRHRRWYLLCYCLEADATRAYRVDRVQAVDELAEASEPPADLDPVEFLEHHLASGWPYVVTVRIETSADIVRDYLPRSMGTVTPLGEALCELVGSTSDADGYAQDLAHLPAPFTVVAGDEVREALRSLSRRLAAAAEGRSS